MAVGNTANLSVASVNTQIAADAAYMRGFYDWCKRKYSEWNTNAGTGAALNTIGFTQAADQNLILTVIADMNRLINIYEGGTQSVGENIVNDVASVLGVSN